MRWILLFLLFLPFYTHCSSYTYRINFSVSDSNTLRYKVFFDEYISPWDQFRYHIEEFCHEQWRPKNRQRTITIALVAGTIAVLTFGVLIGKWIYKPKRK